MGLRKSTRIEDYRMIHVWDDPDLNFHAEVCKENGWWVVRWAGAVRTVQLYQRAVDTVMDEWRLAKAGFETWEEAAREMAEGPWEDLSDGEQQDLVNAARLELRTGA